jgi:hypothetical protein
MSDFITLSCPSCNGKLQITEDIDRFACIHCGNEHVVKRGGGIVTLKPVLERVSKGVDNTASELAIVRLDKEISILEDKYFLLQSSVDKATGFLVCGILLIISGVVAWISLDCVSVGVILILIGLMMSVGYFLGSEKKSKMEKLEQKIKELKISRKAHYDRVNKV